MPNRQRSLVQPSGPVTSEHSARRQKLIDTLSVVCCGVTRVTVTQLDAVIPRPVSRCERCVLVYGDEKRARWARWSVRVMSHASHARHESVQCDMHVHEVLCLAIAQRDLDERQLGLFDRAGDAMVTEPSYLLEDVPDAPSRARTRAPLLKTTLWYECRRCGTRFAYRMSDDICDLCERRGES